MNLDLYYGAINEFYGYGERKAERSGVPLINHIDEGLKVLRIIGASDSTEAAFCIHPLFQPDDTLAQTLRRHLIDQLDPFIVALAMEYRSQANRYLSAQVGYGRLGHYWISGRPNPGPLPEVRDMLIADKVQNRADFMLYHFGKHKASARLDFYFRGWLDVLGITEERYERLVKEMKA